MNINDTPVLNQLRCAEAEETYLDARILEAKERLAALEDQHADLCMRIGDLRAQRSEELRAHREEK
ncbi:MAG: hypothetical protein KKB12_04390 [Candidatus Omnitrophica bacterium]|nr:hypothetical protein [Candidatus Omnitrophota bacterium]